MSDNSLLNLKAERTQTAVKVVGTGAVVLAASAAVVVVGASALVASTIAIAGLFMVNYAIPVAARSIALWRQNTITKLTETFSEETIREDEYKESERIKILEQQYVESRSELEGAQEELRGQLMEAQPEERQILEQQIKSLQTVIDDAFETLKTRKEDFIELQRVNKLYIALHRSASAMEKASGANRNSDELQRLETARTSIKNKMRAAMAGKTIDAMNSSIKTRPSLTETVGSLKLK